MKKILMLFLALLSIICFCACGEQSVEKPFEEHVCNFSWKIKHSTCTEKGLKEYICSECGYVEVAYTILTTGHSFFNCNDLTSVYYMGTAEQWNDIVIEDGNIWLTEANRYYYSERKPTVEGNFWHYVDGVPTVW